MVTAKERKQEFDGTVWTDEAGEQITEANDEESQSQTKKSKWS